LNTIRCRWIGGAVARPGAAVTVLTYGSMVHVALAAALDSGIDAEIIDLRTLVPLDIGTITTSVEKTGRCVIVHEATRTSGFGAELSALVQEHCFYHLETRSSGWRVGTRPIRTPSSGDYFPGPARVAAALRRALEA